MFHFTHALVRRPGPNFAEGLTTAALGRPDHDLALQQHEAYCDALRRAGLEVIVLDADARYPDGCFVEDVAVITERTAVITRPGAPSRRGEAEAIIEVLSAFRQIAHIEPPGTLEGGDVLQVGHTFFIGLSGRTNEHGARQLAEILEGEGYTVQLVPVQGVLHLKTGLTALDTAHFLGTDWFARQLKGFAVFPLPAEEAYAANCLPVNDCILLPRGYPTARAFAERQGKKVIEVPMSEFRKMDGGLTCLSLRWRDRTGQAE